jgi:hypothetical protein
MLIREAFNILSGANDRIAELGVEIVDAVNSPLEPKLKKELTEVTQLYNIIREHIVLNNQGTAIIGTVGDDKDDESLNKLFFQLKKAAKIFDYPVAPNPVKSYTTQVQSSYNSLPSGSLGDLLYYQGGWTTLGMGNDGDVLVSTPTGLQWQSIVGNGIPSGGTTGQVLAKDSNTSYDASWQSLSLSMLGVTASAIELNYVDGVTSNIQEQINAINDAINGSIGNALTDGYFLVGNDSNVATAVQPTGDVTFTNAGVFSISVGAIVDTDINASAAITRSKLATGSAYRVVVNDASGVMTDAGAITASRILISDSNGIPTHSSIASSVLNYLDATSSIQTQLDSKLTVDITDVAAGDLIHYNGTSWINIAIGTNGQVLRSDGSSIYWGDAAGNGLPEGGTATQVLRKIDGVDFNTEWHTLLLADIVDVTATAAELSALSGLTVNAAKLNYLTNVTYDIHSKFNEKLDASLSNHSLWVGGAGNTPQQVSAGVDGAVLTVVSGHPTWQLPPVPGTFTGPVSSTDNAVVRFNGTDGTSGQNSGVIIDDSDNVSGIASLSTGQVSVLNQAAIRLYETGSTNYVAIRSSGTMSADYTITLPAAAPSSNTYLKYDGTNYVWASAAGGGTAVNQKTEPGSSYAISDADNGYIIYFTDACEVTLPDTVSDNVSVTIVRLGGLIEHLDDGTSVLKTVGSEYNIEEVNGAATWVKNGTNWYGWGSLGPAGGGGSGSYIDNGAVTTLVASSGIDGDGSYDYSISVPNLILTGTTSLSITSSTVQFTTGSTEITFSNTGLNLVGATSNYFQAGDTKIDSVDVIIGGIASGPYEGSPLDLKLIALPSTSTSNVLYYNTTTGAVTYGLAPSGGTWGGLEGDIEDQTDLVAYIEEELTAKGDALVTTVSKTASYIFGTDAADLTDVDAGKDVIFEMNVASANTFTIPLDSTTNFPIGTVRGIRQTGAGQTTVDKAVGVTLNGPLNAFKLAAQGAIAFIEKTAANTWYINGETVI